MIVKTDFPVIIRGIRINAGVEFLASAEEVVLLRLHGAGVTVVEEDEDEPEPKPKPAKKPASQKKASPAKKPKKKAEASS